MNIVVGSGPAGIACAEALLSRGEPVCLVDAGLTLETERREVIARMRTQTPAEWAPEDLGRIREGMHVTSGGVLLKRIFGSDFAYRGPAEHIALQSTGSALTPSLAQGGLSNVWGAAVLPYTAADLKGWPLTAAELQPHYEAALRLTGLTGSHDGLEELLPLYGEPTPLRLSRQARRLWAGLDRHAPALRRRGWRYGAARVAVQAPGARGQPGCVHCGLCMYGCPYDFIYHTGQTLRQWQGRPGFTYVPGVLVETVEESGSGVRLRGYRLGSDEPWSMEGSRLFLGAGVLPTSKIFLHSRGLYERPLHIQDSQYFLFPMLQAAGTPGVREESLYTLSQMFLELNEARLGEHTVHLQIYSYSDLIGQAIRQTLGPLGRWDWLCRQMEGRFLIVQGYLHSQYSSRMRLELRRGGRRASELRVEAEVNAETRPHVRRVVRTLLRQAGALRALPLEPFLQVTPPGRGFHSGGSLPMRATPGELETDTLGRPPGWERIHLVDSTVFPTIPATTITLSVMANAHRIASAVAG